VAFGAQDLRERCYFLDLVALSPANMERHMYQLSVPPARYPFFEIVQG
jgi:hypothetical protein